MSVDRWVEGVYFFRVIFNIILFFLISFLYLNVGKKFKYKISVRRKILNFEFNEVG